MTVKITLKTRDKEGKIGSEQVEIDSMNGFQFQAIMKVINSIAKKIQADESIKGLFQSVFGGQNINDLEIADVSNEIIKNAVGSFDTLLINMPDKAYELLSAATGIDVNLLLGQKVEDIFDVYDAIVETNDIEKLVDRVKKSLALTKTKMAFMKIGKKIKEAATPQASPQ